MQTDPTPIDTDLDNDDLAETPDVPAVPGAVDISALATAIVGAVNAAQGPRKITNGEYMRTRSVHRDKPQLARKCFQNGIELFRSQLSADAIEMLNVLQPGVYADGLISVLLVRNGAKLTGIDIQYSNKTIDERMAFKSKFQTFEHMLAALLRERQSVVTV